VVREKARIASPVAGCNCSTLDRGTVTEAALCQISVNVLAAEFFVNDGLVVRVLRAPGLRCGIKDSWNLRLHAHFAGLVVDLHRSQPFRALNTIAPSWTGNACCYL